MQALIKDITKDLSDLFTKDKIEEAIRLNNNLGMNYFSSNFKPMFFNGNYEAKTVFVMLNPGAGKNDKYSFLNTQERAELLNLENFIDKYISEQRYAGQYKNKIDNFDLKQAAFLYDFQNSGINIPDFFSNTNQNECKLKAQESVLINKLQLELIPYYSSNFIGLFDTEKNASKNIDSFMPHIKRTLDVITEFEREYVLFGAKQFYYLFKAYNDKSNAVKFYKYNATKIDGLKNKISWQCIEIIHNRKIIKGLIANSFPRRDLPNAYNAMRKYGEICFNDFTNEFN
jgi:hypothetical protein